jgi:hypothetical protein
MKQKYQSPLKKSPSSGVGKHPAFSDAPVSGKTKRLIGVPRLKTSSDANVGTGSSQEFDASRCDAEVVKHSKDSLRGSSQRLYSTVAKQLKIK